MNSRLLTLCDNAVVLNPKPSIADFKNIELLGSPIDLDIEVQRNQVIPSLRWGGGHPIPITIRVRKAPVGLVSGGTTTFALVSAPSLKASGDANFLSTVMSELSSITIFSGYLVAVATWSNSEFDVVGREFSFYIPTQITTGRYIQLGALGSHEPDAGWNISAWIGGPDTRNWTAFTEGFR